jgi:hypothetical protein
VHLVGLLYEIHVERLNTPCGQNVDFVQLNLTGHTLVTVLKKGLREINLLLYHDGTVVIPLSI